MSACPQEKAALESLTKLAVKIQSGLEAVRAIRKDRAEVKEVNPDRSHHRRLRAGRPQTLPH